MSDTPEQTPKRPARAAPELAKKITNDMQASLMYSMSTLLVKRIAAVDPDFASQVNAMLKMWDTATRSNLHDHAMTFDRIETGQGEAAKLKEMFLTTHEEILDVLVANFRHLTGVKE